jgi:alkylation response protein AidB-like acyl-CoA dehydrogenase
VFGQEVSGEGMLMGHYRSNLRDLEFNLFEVHRIQEYLGTGAYAEIDLETARDVLREIERLASSEWADSFVVADRTPLVLEDGEIRLPEELKHSLAVFRENGWDRVGLPTEMGGMPVPPSLFWSGQEMLLGANPTAVFYAGGPLFARILWEEGNDEQKEIARLMVEKGWGATMVLTEPDAGSDVGAGTTRAVQVEGDVYHLEGVKRFITSGEHDATDNIIHLVLARPEGAAPGTKGLSLFVVPKYLFDAEGNLGERNGVVATNVEKKMGLKGSSTCELTFGMDRPAVGYLVGSRHDGIRQMFRVIEAARMTIGTKSASTLSTGYLNALEYAQQRVQGPDMTRMTDKTAPRTEIIRHPDVRRMLMLQKAYAEGMRALWTFAAWCQDQAVLHPEDDTWERRSDLLLPMVKGYSSEKAYQILATSLQTLGGSGYTQDYPIEQYIRDAKIDTVYEGTTGIQAMDLFFRKIARDQGQTIAAMSAEIVEFVKATGDDDPIRRERETLGRMLDDAQAQVGVMVNHLMATMGGAPTEIYKIGLVANDLLESLSEVVIAWQLLRHAEIAAPRAGDDPFYAGKVAAARFFVADVAPKVAARRASAEAETGWLMEFADAAF